MSSTTDIQLYSPDALSKLVWDNIPLSQVKASKLLNEIDREVILAAYGNDKIKDRPKQEVGNELKLLINKAIFDSGFGASWTTEELQFLILGVIDDVLRDFSRLTVQEVQIAFRNGVREQYGELYGLSVRAFYKWIRAYLEETKIEASAALRKLEKPKMVEVSEEEKEEIHEVWLERIYGEFEKFKKSGEYGVVDYGNMLYVKLEKLGIIKFSKKRKEKILKDATGIVKGRYGRSNAKNSIQREDFKKIVERIDRGDGSMSSVIKIEARHLALKIFLTECVKKKKELRTLIQSAQ